MNSLDRLFRPQTVAVVGGGVWGASIIRNCREIGHSGEIWVVHPNRSEIEDVRAVPTVEDLPGAPDAAFVGVNRGTTIDVVRALSARGAGGAVCLASGFRESEAETGDGADLEDQLLAAAGEMRLIGPNCYGFINYLDGAALWPDQHGGQRVARGVAILTQSSNIALNITMQRRGLPVAYIAACGNQSQTSMAEMAKAMIEDDRVTALGLHVEGFGDLRRFEALAQAAHAMGKPVVVLKVGRSEQARAATISHTASLAGAAAGADAFLARLGFAQVTSVATFLETLKLLHVNGPLRSNRIASLSCSGGEAALIADLAEATDLTFPPLIEAQRESLRKTLGPKIALANPLDYNTFIWGKEDALTEMSAGMVKGDLAMTCMILDYPRNDRCSLLDWDATTRAVKTTAANGAPMAVVASVGELMPEDVARDFVDNGVTAFCGLSEAVEALEAGAWLGQARFDSSPLLLPAAPENPRTQTEADAKAELSRLGLRVPRSGVATCPQDAASAATAIGFPVVLKGQGTAHKTEAGIVALNLKDAESVEAAARAMPAESFLVEEMVSGAVTELLIGVTLDPAHGYVLTIGAGGVLTELMDDTVSMLIPSDDADVRTALKHLKISKLLDGYRGASAADPDAILAAVTAVQDYVMANPGLIVEAEINPLICTPTDAIAADALIRKGDPQ